MSPLFLMATASLAAEPVERYALLVGHNHGGPGRTELRYAHSDANSMAAVLEQLGGVRPDHDVVLLDPTRAQLVSALASMKAQVVQKPNAEFVFYYSGHSDEVGLMLGSEAYGYSELRQALDSMPARFRVGILDSCASGSLILTKGGVQVPAFLRDESTNVGGSAYLTSSAANEVAQEAERVGGSYFTHYLASGLRGAADATGDRRVTLQEAYVYASGETLAQTAKTEHGPQHANHLYNTSGTGELVLTDLTLTNASLVLDATLAGHALIYDQHGDLVVELSKVGGRDVEIGLAEGRYTVGLVQAGRYGEASVTLALGTSNLLEASEISWSGLERAVARGDLPDLAQISPVEDEKIPNRWPRISILPELPGGRRVGADTLVVSLIADVSPELRGAAFALGGHSTIGLTRGLQSAVGYTTAGELQGFQSSVGFNLVNRDMSGLQASVGGNVAGGAMRGGQLATGFNVAGDGGRGLQAAVGANVVAGDFTGLQVGVGANIVSGALQGVQISTGFNQLSAPSRGMQVSAGVNSATGELAGSQIGIVNFGVHVTGAQIGIVNIAGEVDGAQVGIVNVARDVHGPSIGLLSLIEHGRHDVLLFTSESDLTNVELKLGSNHFHSILGVGAGLEHGYISYGLGGHLSAGRAWVDLDALASSYVPAGLSAIGANDASGAFHTPPTSVVRGRATLGFQLAKEIAPFAGVSWAFRLPTTGVPLVDIVPDNISSGENVLAWPGFVAGVQF